MGWRRLPGGIVLSKFKKTGDWGLRRGLGDIQMVCRSEARDDILKSREDLCLRGNEELLSGDGELLPGLSSDVYGDFQ